jgi:hypothetical protein
MHMATATKRWTLEELHSLPDDGNKYELVRGELYVTHLPFRSTRPSRRGSRRFSDRMCGHFSSGTYITRVPCSGPRGPRSSPTSWCASPQPARTRVGSTCRFQSLSWRSFQTARAGVIMVPNATFTWYTGIAEYWIVDAGRATITVVRPGEPDRIARDRLTWAPEPVGDALEVELSAVFGRSVASRAIRFGKNDGPCADSMNRANALRGRTSQSHFLAAITAKAPTRHTTSVA